MGPKRTLRAGVLVVVLVLMAGIATATSGSSAAPKDDRLEMYRATVDATTLQTLQSGGYDIASVRETARGVEVALVLTRAEHNRLRDQGVRLTVWRDKDGRTQSQRAAVQSAEGFTVWRSFDEPGGLRDEMYQLARRNPQLVKLEVLGKTHEGREYIALKLTQSARDVPDGTRPAVLYASTYHAREWISPEVNRRLLNWYIDRWRANDRVIRRLLKDVELWFVLVHNPDGYEYTFDVERLWRKNLRDNDGNGDITSNDGVDPNRNHSEHWNYDNEGSSSLFPSQTYRGPAQ
jgi:Zinc carboxypeptidase